MSTQYTYRLFNGVHELAKFEDTSAPVANYELREKRGGGLACACPAAHGGRPCKHPVLVELFKAHGWEGWLLDMADGFIDLFPVPRGSNHPLIELREGDQSF
jgi:hypothetical protein